MDPEPETTAMTSPEIARLKMITALIEAIDPDDEDDAKMAMKTIRALIGADKDKP